MKDTLRAIRDHFVILFSLIIADFILKVVLHLGERLLDPSTVEMLSFILSRFLVFVVLIFTVCGAFELLLHGAKGAKNTVSTLFPKHSAPAILKKKAGQ